MSVQGIDTLKLARRLRDGAGFTPEHAEAAAEAFSDALTVTDLVTKDHLELKLSELEHRLDDKISACKADLKADIADLRTELTGVRTELKGEISGLRTEATSLRTELKGEISGLRTEATSLRTELKGEINELRTEATSLKTELKGEISGLRTELKGEIAGVKAELRTEIAGLKADLTDEIAHARVDMMRWGIGTVLTAVLLNAVVVVGSMVGLVKLMGAAGP